MIRRYLWVGSCQKEVHPTETSNLQDYNTMMIRMIFRAPRRMRCKVFFIKPSNLELHYIVLEGAQDCVWATKTKMDAYHSDSEMPDASVLGDRFDGQKYNSYDVLSYDFLSYLRKLVKQGNRDLAASLLRMICHFPQVTQEHIYWSPVFFIGHFHFLSIHL